MFGLDRERRKNLGEICVTEIHRKVDFTCCFNNNVKIDHKKQQNYNTFPFSITSFFFTRIGTSLVSSPRTTV
jgi:hypothetical protein